MKAKRKKEKCIFCDHDGNRRGGGFQNEECEECDGAGFHYFLVPETSNNDTRDADKNITTANKVQIKIDKRNKNYKNAVAKILEADTKLTKEDAERLFEQEMSK